MACVPALLVLLFATAVPAHAMNYIVGDTAGWTLGFNYSIWSSRKTFRVGDTLLFIYNPSRHDLEEVSRSDYISCKMRKKTYTDGNTRFALTRTGSRYFICGIDDHCAEGMKVAVTVSRGTRMPPSPSRAPAPAPSSGPRVHGRSMFMRLVAYFG